MASIQKSRTMLIPALAQAIAFISRQLPLCSPSQCSQKWLTGEHWKMATTKKITPNNTVKMMVPQSRRRTVGPGKMRK